MTDNIEQDGGGKPLISQIDEISDRVTQLEQANANLQQRLSEEQGNRREDRFMWIVVCVALVDMILLKDAENAIIPVVALVLEVLVLAILARRLGIGRTAALVDKLLSSISGDIKPHAEGG